MSNLLKEAILDAKQVRKLAEHSVKQAMEEAFNPILSNAISNHLAEEDEIEDEDPTLAEPEVDAAPVAPVEPEATPVDDLELPDPDSVEPAEDDDQELEEMLRELDGLGGDEVPDSFENSDDWDDVSMVSEDDDLEADPDLEDEDPTFEALLRELDGDEDDMDDEPLDEGAEELYGDDPASNTQGDLRDPHNETRRRNGKRIATKPKTNLQLQKENKALRVNLQEAMKAVAYLKKSLNEVSLVYSKLQYTSKLLKNESLTKQERSNIIAQFDRARNLKEAQLVYTSFAQSAKNKQAKPRTKVLEHASRPGLVIKPTVTTDQYSFVGRWKELANIKTK